MAAKKDFTLNDFRKQLDQLEKMKDGMLAHMPRFSDEEDQIGSLRRIRGMIDAMTEEERADPDSINLSRYPQIAAESDSTTEEVQQFLKQFKQIQGMMRRISQMSLWERIKLVTGFSKMGPLKVEEEE